MKVKEIIFIENEACPIYIMEDDTFKYPYVSDKINKWSDKEAIIKQVSENKEVLKSFMANFETVENYIKNKEK